MKLCWWVTRPRHTTIDLFVTSFIAVYLTKGDLVLAGVALLVGALISIVLRAIGEDHE